VPGVPSKSHECAILTFDPQLKKILTFSVKDRYQLNYFICIKDFNAETNTSLKLNLFSVGMEMIRNKRIAPTVFSNVYLNIMTEAMLL
jgi:hypothetical protein